MKSGIWYFRINTLYIVAAMTLYLPFSIVPNVPFFTPSLIVGLNAALLALIFSASGKSDARAALLAIASVIGGIGLSFVNDTAALVLATYFGLAVPFTGASVTRKCLTKAGYAEQEGGWSVLIALFFTSSGIIGYVLGHGFQHDWFHFRDPNLLSHFGLLAGLLAARFSLGWFLDLQIFHSRPASSERQPV